MALETFPDDIRTGAGRETSANEPAGRESPPSWRTPGGSASPAGSTTTPSGGSWRSGPLRASPRRSSWSASRPRSGRRTPRRGSPVGPAWDLEGAPTRPTWQRARERIGIMNRHGLAAIVYGGWGPQIDWIGPSADDRLVAPGRRGLRPARRRLLPDRRERPLDRPFAARALLPARSTDDLHRSRLRRHASALARRLAPAAFRRAAAGALVGGARGSRPGHRAADRRAHDLGDRRAPRRRRPGPARGQHLPDRARAEVRARALAPAPRLARRAPRPAGGEPRALVRGHPRPVLARGPGAGALDERRRRGAGALLRRARALERRRRRRSSPTGAPRASTRRSGSARRRCSARATGCSTGSAR